MHFTGTSAVQVCIKTVHGTGASVVLGTGESVVHGIGASVLITGAFVLDK